MWNTRDNTTKRKASIKYLGPTTDWRLMARLCQSVYSNEIHNDRVHCCNQVGNGGAIVFRSIDPSDFIASYILSRAQFTRFEAHRFAFDENARVVHGDDRAMDRLGSLFAHEIVYNANAVLIQITNDTLTNFQKPLHSKTVLHDCSRLPHGELFSCASQKRFMDDRQRPTAAEIQIARLLYASLERLADKIVKLTVTV